MRRHIGLLFVLVAGVAFSCGLAVMYVVSSGQEIATVTLSVPVLVLTATTFWLTLPRPARLEVLPQSELELTDLIFYLYDESIDGSQVRVPRDYLLQLHVAVTNSGDTKAVLSSLRLEAFITGSGKEVSLPEGPTVVTAMEWHQRSGWVNGSRHFENLNRLPPYVLERDDVITLRFRTRRGIDWTDRWDVDAIRRYCVPLAEDIVAARGRTTWRTGSQVRSDPFHVPVKVLHQDEYLDAIRSLTQEFTERPALPPHPIQIQ